MSFRFRKRIRILPGLWLNVSKSGVSTSIGGKGVTVNVGEHGTSTTVGVPGTGLSYSHRETFDRKSDGPPRSSSQAVRLMAIILWVFLIGYLAWAMH